MAARPVHLVLVAALACAPIGCTGDGDSPGAAPSSSASTAGSTTLAERSGPLKVSIEQLHGGIKPKQRRALKRAIAKPIATWIYGAYSGERDSRGFAGWTKDAAGLARRDADVTTSERMSKGLSALVIDRSQARLYVFARKGHTGGATARVRFRLTGEREDGSSAAYAVIGELYLTRDARRWRIFGYDLSRKGAG